MAELEIVKHTEKVVAVAKDKTKKWHYVVAIEKCRLICKEIDEELH